jgi:nucleoside-diphosphate-sugar epimerase
MHFTRDTSTTSATPLAVKHTGLWSWSSVDAVVRGCVLGLTSDGWSGAEAFHIAAGEIYYPPELSGGVEVPALQLLEEHWSGRVKRVDKEWWAGHPRRGFFDTSKAERMLGWQHDE